MEVRKRVREAYANNLNVEMRPVIRAKLSSLQRSGVEFESFDQAFALGYLSGMENPTFEAVVESVKIMKRFSELNPEQQEIITLVMDGMRARYNSSTKDTQ